MKQIDTGVVEQHGICSAHGEYTACAVELMGRVMGGECPQCQAERRAREREREEAHKRYARTRRVERLLGSSGIPPRFIGRSFENYRADTPGQAKALRLCAAYADRFEDALSSGACMIMIGGPGTGKTHLAAAMAQAIVPTGRSVHFTTVGRLLRRVKSTYSKDSEHTEEEILQSYRDPDLLILDEVGVQRGTESERFILTETLGLRYEHMRPMVVMGNCTEGELGEHLGDRLVSRLQEGGGPILVFDWEDYRPKVHADKRLPKISVEPVRWGDELVV